MTMDLKRSERTLQIVGKSKTRDDLLKFKTNLETSPLIREIQFPLSNLLLKENIKFEYVLCSDCSTPTVTSTVVVKAPENVMYKIGVRSYIYLAVEVRLN